MRSSARDNFFFFLGRLPDGKGGGRGRRVVRRRGGLGEDVEEENREECDHVCSFGPLAAAAALSLAPHA